MKDQSWEFPGYGETRYPELPIEYVAAAVTENTIKTIRIRIKNGVSVGTLSPADFEIMDDRYNSPVSGSTEYRVHQIWREDDILTLNVAGLPYLNGTTYTIRTKNYPGCLVDGKHALVIRTRDIVFFDECEEEADTITRYKPPLLITERKTFPREYRSVTAECYVGIKGMMAERFILDVGEDFRLDGLTADCFTAYAIDERNRTMGSGRGLSLKDGKLILEVKDFPVTTKFRFVCFKRGFYRLGLGFTYREITEHKVEGTEGFAAGTYQLSDDFTLLYRLYEPKDAERPLPLVLTIGAGGVISGDNNITQLWSIQPLGFAAESFQKKHPCYVLVPQNKNVDFNGGWSRRHMDGCKAVIRRLIAEGKVDGSRVYFCGEGLGNRISLLFREPEFFAAAMLTIPVWCDYEMLSTLKDLPIWLTSNAGEQLRMLERSRMIYQHLVKYGNTQSRYTEYTLDEIEEMGGMYCSRDYHFANMLSYNDDEKRSWLFEHARKEH